MASIIQIKGKWRAQIRVAGMSSRCATFSTEDEARSWASKEEKAVRSAKRGVLLDPLVRPAKYRQAGVYALFLGAEVQYVGRSSHIYRRLRDHDRKCMNWDGFRIWTVSGSVEAAELEKRMIQKHRPPLNISMKPESAVDRGDE